MKNKGYVLTMDAVIALIFVIGVFIAVLTLDFFNPNETSTTAFLNLHYVAEDSMDVLNKVGVLDEIGYYWSLNTNESLEDAKTISNYYLNLTIPRNVGYKLEIVENGVITNISNSDNETNGTRPKMDDVTVITHSSRFLVGFGKEKPIIGSVARAYLIAGGLSISGDLWDFIDCKNIPGLCNDGACCEGSGCTATATGGLQDNCLHICAGANCELDVAHNTGAGYEAVCCGFGNPCTFATGNNLEGDNTEHSSTVTCCGPGCSTGVDNNILKGVDIICCGDGCITKANAKNQINCATNKGPNNIVAIGNNSRVEINKDNSIDIKQTNIFCAGENCSVYIHPDHTIGIESSVFCCGTSCNVSCNGCNSSNINPPGKCPPPPLYDFCEQCDIYCEGTSGEGTFVFPVSYGAPKSNAYGSKNITIHMDTDGDNISDRNCTIDEWPPLQSGENRSDDPAGFNPENDSSDDALVRLLDDRTWLKDKNPGSAVSLINYSTDNGTVHHRWEYGDGGSLNPINLNYNCSNIKFDGVRVENIRSLWGPVQFKLIVWM